jgi:uncharacterized protein YfaT (DUF1175 family)
MEEAKRLKLMTRQSLFKRDKGKSGCSKLKVAKINIVADCNYVSYFKGQNKTSEHVTTIINKVSKIYRRDLKIIVSIAGSEFKKECQERWNVKGCKGYAVNTALNDFQIWVSKNGKDKSKKGIAYNHLFTTCRLEAHFNVYAILY